MSPLHADLLEEISFSYLMQLRRMCAERGDWAEFRMYDGELRRRVGLPPARLGDPEVSEVLCPRQVRD